MSTVETKKFTINLTSFVILKSVKAISGVKIHIIFTVPALPKFLNSLLPILIKVLGMIKVFK
jgi:hypothetical protein